MAALRLVEAKSKFRSFTNKLLFKYAIKDAPSTFNKELNDENSFRAFLFGKNTSFTLVSGGFPSKF